MKTVKPRKHSTVTYTSYHFISNPSAPASSSSSSPSSSSSLSSPSSSPPPAATTMGGPGLRGVRQNTHTAAPERDRGASSDWRYRGRGSRAVPRPSDFGYASTPSAARVTDSLQLTQDGHVHLRFCLSVASRLSGSQPGAGVPRTQKSRSPPGRPGWSQWVIGSKLFLFFFSSLEWGLSE